MAQQSATSASERAARASITVPPCPDWCQREAGHNYDDNVWDKDPWTFTRTHSQEIGTVEVCSIEQQTAGGVVSFWEPFCALDFQQLAMGDLGEGLFGLELLTVLRGDLQTAESLLEEIKAAQS